jgi:pilus assembly protein Flp/PilA
VGRHIAPDVQGTINLLSQELQMKHLISRFVKDESGATAVEYGLVVAGISLAIIAIINSLGSQWMANVSSDLAAGRQQ